MTMCTSKVATKAMAALGLLLACSVWAQPAVWTPSADAPEGILAHQLEATRHNHFIDLAKKGDIDFVLFGTTDAEMFWWPDRGKPVWEKAFAAVKAANFGAQGTHPKSLIWRMQNGELDGYQAKLIVLQAAFCFNEGTGTGSASESSAVIVENCAPVLAEIRARQPQAKVLIIPPFPRGTQNLEGWRQISKDNAAAFAALVDDQTVFYNDIGERFYLTDGTHNQEMWRNAATSGLSNVGIQPAAFEVWAAELQPWLERFVR